VESSKGLFLPSAKKRFSRLDSVLTILLREKEESKGRNRPGVAGGRGYIGGASVVFSS